MDRVNEARISEIYPRVNIAGKTTFPPGHDGANDVAEVEDHDIQLTVHGRGSIVICGVEYPMEKGDLVTVYPGEDFYIKAYGDIPFTRYFIHLDFFRAEGMTYLTPVLNDGSRWPRLVRLNYDVDARAKCANMVLRRFYDDEASRLIANGELLSLLGMVMAQYERSRTETESRYTKCLRNILKAEKFIIANYRRQMSVAEMAEVAGLSANYFGSMFKVLAGKTPLDYLTDCRIKQAKRLMVETEHTIGEIAAMVGYEDIHYFSYLFKRREGITPTEFISRFSTDKY